MAERRWSDKFNLAIWIFLDTLERFFTQNKLLKLISLGIALFMWFSISTQGERDRTLENIELKVVNRRPDTVVTGVPVRVVDIRVRGPLSKVTDLNPDKISVIIDATGLSPGNHLVWLSADQVGIPSTVEVLRIDPPNVPLTVEQKISRRVPIKPHLKLQTLPASHVILDSSVTPTTIQATGPESKVDRLKELMTEPIDLSTAGSQMTYTVGLTAPDPSITLSPSTVNVFVDIDALAEKRVTGLKPILPRGVRASPTQIVSVVLKGSQRWLDKIQPTDIIVKLDATKLSKGEHEVSPSVELSERYRGTVNVISVEPERLLVRTQ